MKTTLKSILILSLWMLQYAVVLAQTDALDDSYPYDEEVVPEVVAIPDTTWDYYPTYTAYEAMMAGFAVQYPSLCRLVSFDTLTSGRRLLALVISDNVDSSEAEPRFLYTSSMHGDELVGYVMLLRMADHLLTKYGSDSLATRLVNDLEIWINPLANPDGTFRSGNHTVSGAWRYNANSIDINRNFPDPEDGPHPDGNAWQQETVAFMALAAAQKFNMSANIHGGAEVCNYPWDTWPQLPADDLWWQYVCNMYADSAQFYGPAGYFNDFGTGVTNGYDWYSIDGGRQDYMNYFHLCREFTLEISNTKKPAGALLPGFWNSNYRSLLNYLDQARYGVHGKVLDSITGMPVHAKVLIQGHDIDSSHVWSRMPYGDYYRYLFAGTYTLTFSAAGYHSRSFPGVFVTNNAMTWLDVKLMPTSIGTDDLTTIQARLWYDAVQNALRVEPSVPGEGHWWLRIFSSSGKLVAQEEASNVFVIPHHWKSGLYVANLVTGEGKGATLKFVVTR